jgi:hypothetical protein
MYGYIVGGGGGRMSYDMQSYLGYDTNPEYLKLTDPFILNLVQYYIKSTAVTSDLHVYFFGDVLIHWLVPTETSLMYC